MKLTSEQVHRIGGVAFTLTALLILIWQIGVIKIPWIPYLLPLLLVAYGIEGFLDTWVHGSAAPANYHAETVQHLFQGAAVLVAGVIEGLILQGTLQHPLWGLALPLALVILGGVFLFHEQHDAGVPPLVLFVQHRVFAMTLFVAAAAKSLTLVPSDWASAFSTAWLLPLLLFGLELLVYTEGGGSASHRNH